MEVYKIMSNIENPILKNIKIDPELDKALDKALEYLKTNENPFGQYPKLVRDNIPNIILKNNPAGTAIKYRKLDDVEYRNALKNKLCEEVLEYLESDDVKELADILEVIFALAKTHGETETTLNSIRTHKASTNGKFEDRIYLEEVYIGNKYQDPKDELEESEE